MPNTTRTHQWQELWIHLEPLQAQVDQTTVELRLPEGPAAQFAWIAIPSLTERAAREAVMEAEADADHNILVVYRRSSARGREFLRRANISYLGEDGRAYVRAPGLLVEREQPQARPFAEGWRTGVPASRHRNPFAKRSSRVARWLLLHPSEEFSVSQLANAVDLDQSAVSRAVHALEDAALVAAPAAKPDARRRAVTVTRPMELLEAWIEEWRRRRVTAETWDVGAATAADGLAVVREANERLGAAWAVGGLMGAAFMRRAVEPVEVLIWTEREAIDAMTDALQPEPAARGGTGVIRVMLAPDPWILSLARRINGLPVADEVQLWLDCASAGERALEAADAIAEVAGWQ